MIRDRYPFEHRSAHTPLRELGKERHRLQEHAETMHARLLDDGADHSGQARRHDGQRRTGRDRRAIDDAVRDAPV